MRRSLGIIGVGFIDQSFDEAVDELARGIAAGSRRSLFFANAATLNIAARDSAYRRTLNSADYVYGDGTGVRWAARMRGVRLQSNLNGTDLVPALIRRMPGVRVFMLGGSEAMVARAAQRFPALFPGARLVGWHHGYFDHQNPRPVVDLINRAQADMLLVGFGNPLQERFIVANRALLGAPLVAGVGGLFGFWAGTRRRAPKAFRRAGMEWVHILFSEPGKTRRYVLGNPAFLLRMMRWLPADVLH